MLKKCACVIVNYNDYVTTISLADILKNYTVIDKIIIVDNCSTNNSYEELKKLQHEKVDVISAPQNGGYGYGNNLGVKYADSLGYKYVLISNPDVLFTEEFAEKLVETMEGNKKLAVVSGIQIDINGNRIRLLAWKIPTIHEACIYPTKRAYRKKITLYDESYFKGKDVCLVDCVPGALLMVDAEKFLSVGGYDENMFLYCEETTIAIKLKEAGFETAILSDETYHHNHSVSINQSIKSKSKQAKMIANNRLYILKNYLHADKKQMFYARSVYRFALFKGKIKLIIKKMIRKKS